MRRVKPDPDRVDPRFQCSPLSQAKKKETTQTKLQRVYYQLSFSRFCPEVLAKDGVTNWWLVELQQTVRGPRKTRRSGVSLSSRTVVGTSTPGFGVFLLVVFALQSGSNLSEACGLLREVYISDPAPPPCLLLKLEFVRGWRTKLNETASIREGGGDECCAGETRLCACAQELERERERERDAWTTEESVEKGGASYAARHRRRIMNTKLRTYQRRAKRYRKEDRRTGDCRVHGGEQRDDSSER